VRKSTLWTGIVCPRLALEAAGRMRAPGNEPADRPQAAHDTAGGQLRLVAVDEAAARMGVRTGQLLSDALAIAPRLDSQPRDRRAEQTWLEDLALVAYGFSHQVALTGDGVVLEVGGSRRLHGPLDTLLTSLYEALATLGMTTRLGVAPVAAAASLMASAGARAETLDALEGTLADWPIERLELDATERRKLSGLGLKRIRDLVQLPRFELDRRLGQSVGRYLDQLHGRFETPLVYWQPPESFSRLVELPVPVRRTEALVFVLNRVLDGLEHWLRVRDERLTALHVTLFPEDQGPKISFSAGLGQPGFQRDRLLEILKLKLEPVRITADIERLKVDADSVRGQRPPQADLWSGTNINDAWPALLDRLSARIGEDGLCGVAPKSDHRPEKAWAWSKPGTTAVAEDTPERPAWLLPEPRPCRVDALRLIDGPERIETGWWDGQDCRRDYWVAHDQRGHRLWVFREYKPRDGWFVHGVFG
jgi:protein ImuB